MNFAKYLTSALSAVSLMATPVLAQGVDASASAVQRESAAVDGEGLGGGDILSGGAWVFPLIIAMAVILAFTVADGGNSEEPTSP